MTTYAPTPKKRITSPYSRRDREELWEAMLRIAPAIIGAGDLKHAPAGCAQLVREHAQALLEEWQRAAWPLQAPPRKVSDAEPPLAG